MKIFAFILGLGLLIVSTAANSGEAEEPRPLTATASDNPFESEFLDLLGKLSPAPPLDPQDLDASILALMDTYNIPGAQACIILGDSIAWTNEYGYMDAAMSTPVTDSTLFFLASISKTVVTTALLQCEERDQVDLDADVNNYLPFTGIVSNPNYLATPITCRMILSHVSSIARNQIGWSPDMIYGRDWTGDLSQYLENYLVEGGSTYVATNYLPYEPGTYEEYSDWAFSLLALVVEEVTLIDFETYVQDSVFALLDMDNSSWFLANLDTNNIAMPMEVAWDYAAGNYPRSVVCSDLDGDNSNDLVAANYYSDYISVRLNNGHALYGAGVNYVVGDGPSSVFSGDFDGDEVNDLAVANSTSDNISILLGNGDGSFQAAVNYSAGDYPWSVFSIDLNGDTDLDLAVANGASSTASILLGNGDGTFQSAVDYGTGSAPRSVFSCDLDGVNGNDLVTANRGSGTISVLLNNGNGTFQSKVDYAAGSGPYSISCADFDGDTHCDVTVANYLSDSVSILLNNGDGTFQPAVNYAAGDYPRSVFCSDLDGDNDIDLAVADSSANSALVLLGNGDGTFQPAVSYAVGDGPSSVFCSDLDGDNDNDLVVANSSSDDISIWHNKGDGTFHKYRTVGHVSHPLWPIGLLKTSASQLASHLATIPTYGTFKGERVLDSLTVEQIMTNHYPSVFPGPNYRGLGWFSETVNSRTVWGHTGGLPGGGTLMFVDPVRGNGAILLANVYYNTGHVSIFNLLMALSEEIAGCCIGLTGNVDDDPDGICDIGDLTALIDFLFISFEEPVCMAEANVDGDAGGVVDIGDLTALIDFLFISFTPPADCQ